MLTIHLSDLRFFCYHGLYEEEKIIGGEFIVNAEVILEEPAVTISTLSQSVNYVELYEIIKERMMQPTPLLETVAMELVGNMLSAFSQIRKVSVSISKLSVPINNFEGRVEVVYSKER